MANGCVVLLNDTDVDGQHFGCARVMSNIRSQLTSRGISLAGAVPVSLNWRREHADLVKQANLLIINGEGTLHHGSRKGRWLLEAAQAVKARGGHVILLNALWQDNPVDWAELLRGAEILVCRDSRSAESLAVATGRKVRMIGDLSMTPPVSCFGERNGIVFGDSVNSKVTSHLASLARDAQNAQILPVTSSLKFVSPHLRGFRRYVRIAYAKYRQDQFLKHNPQARFAANEQEYLKMIGQSALSVTGRFHAVCLALMTLTPFVAVQSNSWKIEALIEDIGVNPDRVFKLQDLHLGSLLPASWAFSEAEKTKIQSRLQEWSLSANHLFDEIAELAKQRK